MITLLLVSCSDPRPAPIPAGTPAADQARVVRLQDLPFAEPPVLPPHSRATDAPPPERIPVRGPWHRDSEGQRAGWTTPIPIRPRGLFFYKPEAGIRLFDTTTGKEVPFAYRAGGKPVEWSHDRESLSVWLSEPSAPADGRFELAYPLATEREARLNLKHSGLTDPTAFAWATIQDGWDSRRGLLLPAPGHAAWDLEVPPAAELSFTAGLVQPEVRDAEESDGARLTVTVEADGAATEVWSGPLAARSFVFERIDLSRWSGRKVRLRLTSDPVGNAVFDYLFVAEPAVASRQENPVKVVLVFIDTLRADHTSLYGYERDTTAAIDGLAATSAVFERAYSVAPWTLPTARSIVTGRQPEEYDQARTLPRILGEQGFATAFFAGNVYLSTNFDMHRDWDLHRVGGLWPRADQPTDDALAWLAQHEGRDALVQVHYMDAHLPYLESRSYRHRYAGDAHDKLGERFELNDVRRARIEDDPEAQQYIRDRYDNNIRYATDQIARLVETLDDNDVLLIYADHGEEFWDHGKFEHGHALFEELVHVPLVLRAPGVPAGRIAEPVSLLDLAPTVLDLLGQPIPPEMDGRSLVALVRGDPSAKQGFAERDLGFGRPLYGSEHWGVLHQGRKWTTSEGREALFDLAADPSEKKNLLIGDPADSGAPYRDALANALGREVKVGFRLNPTTYKGRPELGLTAICTVPGGFADVWTGADPLQNSAAIPSKLDDPAAIAERLAAFQVPNHLVGPEDGAVEVCWPPGFYGSREVYLVPALPLEQVGHKVVCSAYLGDANGGKRATVPFPANRSPLLGPYRTPINKVIFDQRQLLWQWGIAPLPAVGEITGTDSEMASMLVELGYLEREGAPPQPEGERREIPLPCEAPQVPLAPIPPPRDPTPKKP